MFAQTTVKIVHSGVNLEAGTTETPDPCDNTVDDQEQLIIDELLGRNNLGKDSDSYAKYNPKCQTTKNPGSQTTKYPGSQTTNNPDYSTTKRTTKHVSRYKEESTTTPDYYTDETIEITTKIYANKGQRGHVSKYKHKKPKQYKKPQNKYGSQGHGKVNKEYGSSGKPPKGYKSQAEKHYESNGSVHENDSAYTTKTTRKRPGPKRYSRKRH